MDINASTAINIENHITVSGPFYYMNLLLSSTK